MERIKTISGLPPQTKTQISSPETSPWSKSYAARVGEILTKSRSGIAQQLSDEEFQFTVAAWVEVLDGHIPEARLNDTYVHASRNRNSTFPLTQFEMCEAWNQIKSAERSIPAVGSYEWDRARKVCPDCNNTGTKLIVKRDVQLGRDYTFGVPCAVIY